VTGTSILREPLDLKGLARPGDYRYTHVMTMLADGSTVGIPVIVLAGRMDGPRILAIAGVHGDEMEGMVGNPPAFRAARRRSPLDGRRSRALWTVGWRCSVSATVSIRASAWRRLSRRSRTWGPGSLARLRDNREHVSSNVWEENEEDLR
jgi:predicted deacylase